MSKKPTEIKDFPGQAVEEHLRRTGKLPGEEVEEFKRCPDCPARYANGGCSGCDVS